MGRDGFRERLRGIATCNRKADGSRETAACRVHWLAWLPWRKSRGTFDGSVPVRRPDAVRVTCTRWPGKHLRQELDAGSGRMRAACLPDPARRSLQHRGRLAGHLADMIEKLRLTFKTDFPDLQVRAAAWRMTRSLLRDGAPGRHWVPHGLVLRHRTGQVTDDLAP